MLAYLLLSHQKQAEGLGITVKTIDEVDYVDLTIDGADEIDENFGGLKVAGQPFIRKLSLLILKNYLDC